MNDLDAALRATYEARSRTSEPPALLDEVLAIPDLDAPQQRSWLPHIDTGGFTMFSALKFVAASVIVVLFGGFLLAGVLTTQQDGEVAPAAVTESPSPMTTEELLSGMVTEEVEPGIFRVAYDGVREVNQSVEVIGGDDGSLWGVQDDGFFQLGGEVIGGPTGKAWLPGPVFVTPDGTFWVGLAADDHAPNIETLWTYDGEKWTEQSLPPAPSDQFQLHNLDGAIWATWPDPEQPAQSIVAGMDDGEWRLLDVPLQRFADDQYSLVELHTVDGEDLWVWTGGAPFGGSGEMRRWVDGEWQRVFGAHDGRAADGGAAEPYEASLLAVAPDGTTWLRQAEAVFDDDGNPGLPFDSLRSFDGQEWQEWSLDDLRAKVTTEGGIGGIGVGPDGSLWISLGETWLGEDDGGGVPAICHGLARFDGERWDRYLADLCTQTLQMGPDGSVWTWAGSGYPGGGEDWGDGEDWWDLYVITPEAVAASE